MATNNHNYLFDAQLQLKDAGLVAASAAATVSSAAQVLSLGAGFFEANLVIDVTACEVDTGNEKYEIEWQLGTTSAFSTYVTATVVKLGDSSVNGSSADSSTGRIVQPVCNEFNGTIYGYARLYTRIAGTIATGINYSAFLSAE